MQDMRAEIKSVDGYAPPFQAGGTLATTFVYAFG